MIDHINDQISQNLKLLRKDRGMTLDDLAEVSGVSKSMLSEIERGGTNPTILVLWKIAEGLRVPLTRLTDPAESDLSVVRANEQSVVTENTDYSIRTIFPYSGRINAEVLSITLPPGGRLANNGHRSGVHEVILVTQGTVTLVLNGKSQTLYNGDAARFDGSMPHELVNGLEIPARLENILFYK